MNGRVNSQNVRYASKGNAPDFTYEVHPGKNELLDGAMW